MRLALRAMLMTALAIVFAVAANARAQTGVGDSRASQDGGTSSVPLRGRIADLDQRLSALKPGSPRAYFELGEMVASEATDIEGKSLARTLYVLAFELDRRATVPEPGLARSACLGLAALADSDDERRWLIALGGNVDDRIGPGDVPAEAMKSTAASRDPAAFDLATALGLARAGEGRRAQRLLERPGVAALLDRMDAVLIPGVGGGAAKVRLAIEQWPTCPRCSNRRVIKESGMNMLCPHCHGAPGPALSTREVLDQVRVESLLLSGVQRSWAAQIVTDGGQPLRELDGDDLAATYGVDRSKTVWKSGQWQPASPGATTPPAAPGNSPGTVPADDAAKSTGGSGGAGTSGPTATKRGPG